MAPVPQASGKEAVGCWARAVASSTTRCVRRRSPNSASANSRTAQGVSSTRPRMLDSYVHRLLLGRLGGSSPQHTSRAFKIKIVSICQKIEAGRMELHVVSFPLAELVSSRLRYVEPLVK